MKPVLWMKSSCTTCRDAKAKLAELGIEVEIRDYFKAPLESAELERRRRVHARSIPAEF